MPTHGEKTIKTTDDGKTQEVFTLEFTNGGIQQLENLKTFFKAEDLTEVVKLGISYLQRLKEIREQVEKQKEENDK